ncbi:MAG: hypothetical protein S4CHLAM45_07060 [Chlamydiales bacterium]|nr:hypothetical protein [Chlamydiales bacterium]MCH9620276.1 hypothetical protein [Chlamydiales bacterium]MCH9622813.1 hypothetical protein [Chlamydiales bacterium]
MLFLINLLLTTIAVFVAGHILPGIEVASFRTALAVAAIFGIVNAVIRPIIFILTLPINVLTLGLFTFVITGFMVYLVAWIVPGFVISNFLWAIAFSFLLSFINWIFSLSTKRRARA